MNLFLQRIKKFFTSRYGGEKEEIDLSNIDVEKLKEDITKQVSLIKLHLIYLRNSGFF